MPWVVNQQAHSNDKKQHAVWLKIIYENKTNVPNRQNSDKIMSMMLSLFEEKRAGICYLTMKNQGTKQKMITRPIWVPWQAAANIANIKYFIYLPQLTRPHVRHVHRLLFVLQTFTHIQIKLYKKEFTKFQPDHVLPEKKFSSDSLSDHEGYNSQMKLILLHVAVSPLTENVK